MKFYENVDENMKIVIKNLCTSEKEKENSILYKGLISEAYFVKLFFDKNNTKTHNECYTKYLYNEKNLAILSYCEGDLFIEIFKDKNSFIKGVENTKKWINENL